MSSLEATNMASSSPPPKPTLEQLRYVVFNYPIIDNHAHNLLLPNQIDSHPFESITSEAQGRALRDVFKSLPHLRAARQLRELYECGEDADWEDVLEQRIEWLRTDPEKLHLKCLQGTHAILMDDGLASPDKVFPFNYHDRYTHAPTRRIVRIETVAETIMESILNGATESDLKHASYLPDTWITFTDEFEREIQEAVQDFYVAGFKTVICYRTGLDIEPDYEIAARDVGDPFERYVERCIRKKKFRIERKELNDYLVLRTLEILSEHVPHRDALSKPLQLHTGLGDNDINLRESNPAYLQPLIENYSKVSFVLLHSSYPYTREAGYLATVYKHVYLDVGEVFPMVSRDGQKAILRQALEIVPGSKLLYSTDGHFFAETYWLANKQFREVWHELMLEYVEKEDVTPFQAIAMTKDILFNNSNILYDLRYQTEFCETSFKSIAWHTDSRPTSSHVVPMPQPVVPVVPVAPSKISPAGSSVPRSERDSTASPFEPPHFPPPPRTAQIYDTKAFETFMRTNPGIEFIYVEWLDYMATMRVRIVPIKEFERMIREGERIGISQGNTGTLQNDGVTPVVNPVGQIYVEPDLRSLRRTPKKDPLSSATVLSFWRDETGRPIPECPRANLETQINDLQFNHGISLLCGFEIEVTFLTRKEPRRDESTTTAEHYAPLTTTHAWGTLNPEQWLQLPMLAEIATSLSEIGIEVQQFHAESGQGQYEFVLPPQQPLIALDSLIQARQVIAQVAARHGLRATLHPQPFPGIGTAAHAHISLNPPDKDMQFFVGGVLKHIPAICAFTMPETVSYDRVVDDSWTGGTWIAWGTQNRETPLRRVNNGRWEIRCLDGLANMYFALSAVIAAGILGVRDNDTTFVEKDVQVNPSQLSLEQRGTYGITDKMPAGFEDAIGALERDEALTAMLTEAFVRDYIAMKRAEQEMLGKMNAEERRVWLIERY